MLVLSRKLNEKVLFPGLQASVQVVSVKGDVVRLGIEAPPGLAVLRTEVAAAAPAGPPHGFPSPAGRSRPEPEPADAAVAGRLEAACAALASLGGRERAGLPADAAAALARIEADLEALRRRLAGPAAKPSPPARPPAGAGRGRRALLVEDNANERELLATLLRMAGLSVDTAGDGADALDYLHTHARPDVILLDMGLPRCDGPTAVRAIRHDPALAGVKVVAVTGHAAEEFDLATGPAGVDRWFRKPVEPAVLVRELGLGMADGGR